MSPSKTFNLAGLGASLAIVPNEALRQRLKRARSGIVPEVNLLALVAAQAAYQYGQPWLDEQLIYLRANRDRLTKRINAMPGLTVLPIEATYGVDRLQRFTGGQPASVLRTCGRRIKRRFGFRRSALCAA